MQSGAVYKFIWITQARFLTPPKFIELFMSFFFFLLVQNKILWTILLSLFFSQYHLLYAVHLSSLAWLVFNYKFWFLLSNNCSVFIFSKEKSVIIYLSFFFSFSLSWTYCFFSFRLNLLALIITGKEQEGHEGKRWGLSSIWDKDDTSWLIHKAHPLNIVQVGQIFY